MRTDEHASLPSIIFEGEDIKFGQSLTSDFKIQGNRKISDLTTGAISTSLGERHSPAATVPAC